MTLNNPAYLDIVIYRGITLQPIVITVTDSNSNPVNLTGWQVAWGTNTFSGLASITNPSAGQITIQAGRSLTQSLPVGEKPWDAILLSNGGVAMGPFIYGVVTVKETLSPMFP